MSARHRSKRFLHQKLVLRLVCCPAVLPGVHDAPFNSKTVSLVSKQTPPIASMELRLIQAFTSRLLTGRPAGTTRWRHAALPCRLENLWQAAGLQDPSCHSRMTGIEISRRKTLHYAMWPTSTQAMAMRSMSSMPLASMKGPAPAPLSSRTRHFPRLRALLRNVQMMSYGNFGSGPQAQP